MAKAIRSITDFSGEYAFLSNLYPVPLAYEGLTYPCAENAVQAAKFTRQWDRVLLTKCTPPQIPDILSGAEIDPNWKLMRLSVMESVLRAKFENLELSFRLQSTGRARILAPHRLVGRYWGHDSTRGRNFLGKILMLIRDSAAPVPRPLVTPLRAEDNVLSHRPAIVNYPTSALSGTATEQLMGSLGFRYDPSQKFRRILVLGEWTLSNGMRVIATTTTPELVLAWISTRSRSTIQIKSLVNEKMEALRGSLPAGTKIPHIRMSRRGVQVQGKFTQYIWNDLEHYGAHVDNINLTHSEMSFVLMLDRKCYEVYKPTADTLAELSQDACCRLSGRNTLYVYESYGTTFSKFALCTTSRLQYTGNVNSAGPVMSNLLRVLNDIMCGERALWFLATLRRIL